MLFPLTRAPAESPSWAEASHALAITMRWEATYLLVELADVEVGLVLCLDDGGVLLDVLRARHLDASNTTWKFFDEARRVSEAVT